TEQFEKFLRDIGPKIETHINEKITGITPENSSNESTMKMRPLFQEKRTESHKRRRSNDFDENDSNDSLKTQNEKTEESSKIVPEKHISNKNQDENNKFVTTDDLIENLFPDLQCRLCGLRFRTNFDFDENSYIDHMEKHQKEKNDTVGHFRPFFNNIDGFINKRVKKIIFKEEFKELKENILVKKKLIFCAICKNKMNVVWDDEADSWAIKDGVRLGDEFVHKECAC
ncbi:mRNA cleavage and polyadenylation factor I/II complex, subunit Pcf11, partial [Pseudoloma neurophilia]